ncbi:MAG: GH25 family lysozyme [Thermoleophilia bacterium]
MQRGVDVSANNGHVDWAQVAQAGYTYAFARATLGHGDVDPTFEQNREGAKAHGLRFGGYHLPYPGSSTADQQAKEFLAVAKPQRGDLLPSLDIENKSPPDKAEAGFSVAELVAWLRAWLAAVEREVGAKPIVYTNRGWWDSRLKNANFADHPLWLAHYTSASAPTIPKPWTSFAIWQHSETGDIGGHKFDLNRCADLAAVTIKAHTTGPPVLELGAHGNDVTRLKYLLTTWCEGHPPPAGLLDNDVFGQATFAAVKRFQQASGIESTGKVGRKTWSALNHVTHKVDA